MAGAPGACHTRAVDAAADPIEPDPQIICIDCGGRAFLLTAPPVTHGDGADISGWQVGDVVAYRCEDCLDRWDIVLDDEPPLGDVDHQ